MARKMTITQALVELKTLDNRIDKAINDNSFFLIKKKSSDKVMGKTVKQLEDVIKGNYDKPISLIKNRQDIKAAIVKSNAITRISVVDSEMTVAEAIETKSTIKYKESLLKELKRQYSDASKYMQNEDNKIKTGLESHLEAMLGNKESRDATEVDMYTVKYEERNGYDFINPLDLQETINTLDKEIQDFKNNVDVALAISNAKTEIEIEE